jgi:hypothetical protein
MEYTGLESYASLDGDPAKAERVIVVCPRAQRLQLKLSVASEVGDRIGLFRVKVNDDHFFIDSWHVIFVAEVDGRVETFIGSLSRDGVLSDEISSFVPSALERIARERSVKESKSGEPGATDNPDDAQR